jgi:hypothetical protein
MLRYLDEVAAQAGEDADAVVDLEQESVSERHDEILAASYLRRRRRRP